MGLRNSMLDFPSFSKSHHVFYDITKSYKDVWATGTPEDAEFQFYKFVIYDFS